MTKRATMQDVADAAGVSLSTVDRILNRRAPVKRATMDHVLSAAERVGYHGVPSIQGSLSDNAPPATFGFLLNGQERALYRDLAGMLAARTRASTVIHGRPIFHHLSHLDPTETADAIYQLGKTCDAIGIVAVDTPETNAAVEALTARGIAVFTLLSDLSTPKRTAFIGADGRKMGRGAGWMIDRLTPRQGTAAVLVGSDAYRAHLAYRHGFRSYLADAGSPLRIIEAGATLESDALAAELTRKLLRTTPDLVSILVAGGGISGVMQELRAAGRADLVLVGTELSSEVDRALSEHLVDAVLSHPAAEVADHVIDLMERAVLAGSRAKLEDQIVPIAIRISETV
ncbi:LacI family DNA-binding transcriptional regulator [Frigidibacter sp. MR17.14]|uniref:LacI family DNA-binding transcriptional regulator n=1 Tax=Frigidibacter sp. MR17.14 TaxID=3126509 RepID=UPI003012B355